MFSKVSKDSIRLAFQLAIRPSNEYVHIRDIADDTGISYHNLAKVAQNLARAGVLESYTGPNGGFRLTKSPHKIFLLDLLEAVDGTNSIESCVLSLSKCGENNPCPLHDHWKAVKLEIEKIVAEMTLAELIGLEDQILQDT